MECNHWELKHHLIHIEELKMFGGKKVCCWRCNIPIQGSLYNCIECGYNPIHMSPNDHCLDFIEQLENDGNKKVVCSVCKEPILDAAYKCSVSECRFVIHKSCYRLSPEISHSMRPDHILPFQTTNKNRCDSCCRSHDKSFFYKCSSCCFKLNIKCANTSPINPNDCQQHKFILLKKRIQFNCNVCGHEQKNIAHLCSIRKLLVDDRCAKLQRTITITSSLSPIIFLQKSKSVMT